MKTKEDQTRMLQFQYKKSQPERNGKYITHAII